MKTSASLVTALSSASEGLMYLSESDYPYEVIHWDNPDAPLTKDLIAQKANIPDDTPWEEVALENFYNPNVPDPDWYGEREKRDATQKRNLMKIMTDNLNNLKVYRFGEIEIDIFIVGQANNGDVVGLRTKAIET